MKKLITTAMLWIAIAMSIMNAQYKYDTLHVIEQGLTIAQVIAPKIHNTKAAGNWSILIEHFQKQMRTVRKEVPEYSRYKIEFVKGQKLTIEDDEPTEKVLKYNIRSGSVIPLAQVSKAILIEGRLEVRLFFNDIEDMYSKNYIAIFETAFEKMKMRPKLVQGMKDMYFPRDEIYYNNSSGLIEKRKSNIGKLKVVGSIDATVGVHRNDFIFNINYGLGVAFGRKGNQSLMLAFSNLYQYDREQSRGESKQLYGGVYRMNSFFSLGCFTGTDRREDDYFHLRHRVSLSLYPRRGGKFTLNWNISQREDDVHIGFEYGIPLDIGFSTN